MMPRILIVAGSDSGGGAGIQADIKTVTMLGGHAMTAITAITAQNTLGVQAVMPVATEMVLAQIRSCVSDIGVDAVKIGMLGSAETAHAVARWLEGFMLRPSPPPFHGEGRGPGAQVNETTRSTRFSQGAQRGRGLRRGRDGGVMLPIVFDPVMVATSGDVLADRDTVAAFERLMRIATLVTPNVPELAALVGRNCDSEVEGRIAAEDLARDFECAVLAKGGHRSPADTARTVALPTGTVTADLITDWLVTQGEWHGWSKPKIDTRHTHGTGCTLASAIATGLGGGMPLVDAIERGIAYVRASLAAVPGLGAGHGPMGHALGLTPFDLLKDRNA